MKICVLVPSRDSLQQAGVRIRYRRLDEHLETLGHTLEVVPIDDFTSQEMFDHDAYIISKCYDARANIAARILADSGRRVGVDLFDDYFSQLEDSRFQRLRVWLSSILELSDFIVCSTPVMAEVAKRAAPALPVHLMNDPSPFIDGETLRADVGARIRLVRDSRRVEIGWFGIGDNPYFSVGLQDLVSFGGELVRFRQAGFDVRLRILTNRRAMTPEALHMLRRLPVSYTLEEWTEEKERQLLGECAVAYIPVNAQPFSRAKSLNRAVSALSAGAQVLSNGYPLYARLGNFVYGTVDSLAADLRRGSPLLREETVPAMLSELARIASAPAEAAALARFLQRCPSAPRLGRRSPVREPLAAVIHGVSTAGTVHKFAQRMGVLSVGSPFSSQGLNFDIRFVIPETADRVDCLVSQQSLPVIGRDIRRHLSPHGKFADREYSRLDVHSLMPGLPAPACALVASGSPMGVTAAYAGIMSYIADVLDRLFPGIDCYYSEWSRLPWRVASSGRTAEREVA